MTIMAGMEDLQPCDIIGRSSGRVQAIVKDSDGKKKVQEFVEYIDPGGTIKVRPYVPDTRVDQDETDEEREERMLRRWTGIDQIG